MNHKSEQSMMFHFLSGIDYSKPWKEVEAGIGYDLGDYSFTNKEYYAKCRTLAKVLWALLHDH